MQQQQQQSFYPPVPPFYRLFRADADGTAERPLPPAPPPPVEGTYQMFGELHTVPITNAACLNPRSHGCCRWHTLRPTPSTQITALAEMPA